MAIDINFQLPLPTPEEIGLGNVDNTSDLNKPISIATQLAIDTVQADIDTHEANTLNPHNVTKTQVGLSNVDNTSDLSKPISTSTQIALDDKYDLSNPNGYETPAQLDTRDLNNRNRSNHTGTQLASTISDFNSSIGTYLSSQAVSSYPRTYAQILALSGTVGQRVYNTTHETEMIYDSFFGWAPISILQNQWWGYNFYTEAMASSGDPYIIATANGGTTALLLSSLSPTTLFGLSTGITTNGLARIGTGSYFIGSTGLKRSETKISMSTLSNVTDRFQFLFGYYNTGSVINQTNGMYFLYDEGGISTGSTASPNWQCVCVRAGVRTFVDSGVPVKDIGTGIQKMRIDDDGTSSNVKFYIDNVLVATTTTNVPLSSVIMINSTVIIKSAGTSPALAYVDYISAKEKFNTIR